MHPEKTCVMQVNVVYAEVLPFVFLFSSAACFARQSIPEKEITYRVIGGISGKKTLEHF